MSSTYQYYPGRRESHPRLDVVPPHTPAVVGHWESCGNAALSSTLLSYGTRWRAAAPLRANTKIGRAGEKRTRDLEAR